ncbi:hypothetical protein EO92_02305 [Methanosarcina sp. 2.H.A.1B.4]|nr:hypothetical protein EO92_02305 [Methanosarcina sp. 2.H.A.1B.4]
MEKITVITLLKLKKRQINHLYSIKLKLILITAFDSFFVRFKLLFKIGDNKILNMKLRVYNFSNKKNKMFFTCTLLGKALLLYVSY